MRYLIKTKKLLYFLFFIWILLLIFRFFYTNIDKTYTWNNAPNMSIICRCYGEGAGELWNAFIMSYLLFWPMSKWPNSDVNLIFDDENILDHQIANVFAHLPPFPNIHFEKKPTQDTFCSNWRSKGYSRQIYSNFYSDLYSNNEYIGIVDADSIFVAQVTPEDLFVDGKPRIIGFNGCCTGWTDSVVDIFNIEPIAEFMSDNAFPVIIKRNHFKLIREYITEKLNASTFEEAFKFICSKLKGKYTQFDLLVHYLWKFKKDEYSWHLRDWDAGKFKQHVLFHKRLSNNPKVIELNRPIIQVMKHLPIHKSTYPKFNLDFFKIIYDYLCLASKNKAGDCKIFTSLDIIEGSQKNLFTDGFRQTAEWKERKMPSYLNPINEIPWSGDISWEEAYEIHIKNLQLREEIDTNKWRKYNGN